MFFRNAGAGANTTIEFVGIEMLPDRLKLLGLQEAPQ